MQLEDAEQQQKLIMPQRKVHVIPAHLFVLAQSSPL